MPLSASVCLSICPRTLALSLLSCVVKSSAMETLCTPQFLNHQMVKRDHFSTSLEKYLGPHPRELIQARSNPTAQCLVLLKKSKSRFSRGDSRAKVSS